MMTPDAGLKSMPSTSKPSEENAQPHDDDEPVICLYYIVQIKSRYHEERELLQASPLSSNFLNLIVLSEAKKKVFPR